MASSWNGRRYMADRYGTSRQAVIEQLDQGDDALLEIDYQGALQVKQIFRKRC